MIIDSVYVSGSVRDIDQVKKVQDKFRNNGWYVAYDWTEYVGGKHGADAREEASAQLEAIVECDAFVLIEHPKLKAGWMELGVAIAHEKPIVIQRHPEVTASMWYNLPFISFTDREE